MVHGWILLGQALYIAEGAKEQGFTQKEGHLFVSLYQVRDDHLIVVPMGLGAENLCFLTWAGYTSEITGGLLELWWKDTKAWCTWEKQLERASWRSWKVAERPRATQSSSLCNSPDPRGQEKMYSQQQWHKKRCSQESWSSYRTQCHLERFFPGPPSRAYQGPRWVEGAVSLLCVPGSQFWCSPVVWAFSVSFLSLILPTLALFSLKIFTCTKQRPEFWRASRKMRQNSTLVMLERTKVLAEEKATTIEPKAGEACGLTDWWEQDVLPLKS